MEEEEEDASARLPGAESRAKTDGRMERQAEKKTVSEDVTANGMTGTAGVNG